ncbi:MAG: hypothetical protein NC925_04705 [Candidatus Omnitrophica bacterium]|nr:hypothetical protein [Candidatus Omnitrophota bacterium]MCM8830822.1 hypothetical protein [Candidatus Omnitrophota bacterium]
MSRNLALLLIFGLCILGPCAVFSVASYASILALGRNPSSAPKIFTAMIITLLFAELLSIVAILVVFQLFSSH